MRSANGPRRNSLANLARGTRRRAGFARSARSFGFAERGANVLSASPMTVTRVVSLLLIIPLVTGCVAVPALEERQKTRGKALWLRERCPGSRGEGAAAEARASLHDSAYS